MFSKTNLITEKRASLVDRFGRYHNYLRISLTDRCNFRCTYCMPHEEMEWTPRSHILSFEEIHRLAKLFASMGVNKIRLTGGEPTTRKGLVTLVEALRSIEEIKLLAMTTNGDAMSSMALPLREAGIQAVNISLDTLKQDRFFEITRRDRLPRVLAGIDASLKAGYESIKINVVAMAGVNDDELCDFVDYFHDQPVEIRFIEFMPFLANDWSRARMISYSQMKQQLECNYTLIPRVSDKSAVAKEFDVEGARVKVGFISSMTDDFCGGCNRIRLTADGYLKVCLFAKSGPSLRDAMRQGASDDELSEIIRNALYGKWEKHPPMDNLIKVNDRPMISIGG